MDASTSTSGTPRRGTLRWAPLGLYVAAGAALLAIAIAGSVPLLGRTFPGFLVLDNGAIAAVYGSEWTGRRAGLPFHGGVVESVEGRPFEGGRAFLDAAAALGPGEPLRLRIRHDGATREFAVPSMRLTAGEYATTLGAYLGIAFTLFVIGGVALALRPDLPSARALALALGSLGALFFLAIDHMTSFWLVSLYRVLEAVAPATMLHLALVFPSERVRRSTRRLLVSAVFLVLAGVGVLETRSFYVRPELTWQWDGFFYLLMAAIGVGMIVSFGDAFFRGRDPAGRARAAVVFTGGLVGFLLPAAALFAFFLLGVEVSTTWWTPFLPVFAVFLLYAIVRHDLLDAERVLRLAVGYVLTTSATLIVYAAGLALASRVLWPGAERSVVASFVLVLGVALSFEPLRQRVQTAIDRVFYRSRVDVGRVLESASAELASIETEEEIRRYVEGVIDEAIAPDGVSVVLDGSAERPAGAQAAQLISFRGGPVGTIACGPKRSGAPYSGLELDLLHGLAAQLALAVHHSRALRALRAAQERLLRTEKLVAVGEFAGAVAHGIRNPLAGIRAAVQVSARRATDGPLAESLERVLSEVDRLELRIRSLLSFSRPFETKPRRTALGALLGAVGRSLESSAAAQGVAIDVDAQPMEIDADPDYLEEALLELGGNGLRAMPDGGTLRFALSREGSTAVVRVSDTGRGIPAGIRHRVFDLFFTTRPEGSGIGLPTVRKIVELHGGTIDFESSGADGTVARVALPLLHDR